MKTIYTSPAIKVVIVVNNRSLCATSPAGTESFTVSSNSYDEDDWE